MFLIYLGVYSKKQQRQLIFLMIGDVRNKRNCSSGLGGNKVNKYLKVRHFTIFLLVFYQ